MHMYVCAYMCVCVCVHLLLALAVACSCCYTSVPGRQTDTSPECLDPGMLLGASKWPPWTEQWNFLMPTAAETPVQQDAGGGESSG